MIKATIYALIDEDNYQIYIGSTIQEIKVRYEKHMTDFRMFLGLTKKGSRSFRSAFNILCNPKHKIICIHEFNQINKEDLHLFESMYILKFRKQGLKIINPILSNTLARKYDYRNFGLGELDFSQPSLFQASHLLPPIA